MSNGTSSHMTLPPKFSIIVPVYNVAPYLRECLDSLIRASRELELRVGVGERRVEIICIDDGSTDGSGSILDEYAEKVQGLRFKVIHQANQGVSAARNAGLEMATGDWILFVDGDDVLAPTALSHFARKIDSDPDIDLVQFGLARYTDGEMPVWGKCDEAWQERFIDESLEISGSVGSFANWAYRRRIVEALRFPAYCVGEDRIFLWRALLKASRMATTSEKFYGYRQRATSVMNTGVTVRKLKDRVSYALDWCEALCDGRKTIPSYVYHLIAVEVTESVIDDLAKLSDSEREEMWRYWKGCLPRIAENIYVFSVWFRFAVGFCRLLPFRSVATLLFAVPRRLKKLGLKRSVR